MIAEPCALQLSHLLEGSRHPEAAVGLELGDSVGEKLQAGVRLVRRAQAPLAHRPLVGEQGEGAVGQRLRVDLLQQAVGSVEVAGGDEIPHRLGDICHFRRLFLLLQKRLAGGEQQQRHRCGERDACEGESGSFSELSFLVGRSCPGHVVISRFHGSSAGIRAARDGRALSFPAPRAREGFCEYPRDKREFRDRALRAGAGSGIPLPGFLLLFGTGSSRVAPLLSLAGPGGCDACGRGASRWSGGPRFTGLPRGAAPAGMRTGLRIRFHVDVGGPAFAGRWFAGRRVDPSGMTQSVCQDPSSARKLPEND